MTCAASVLAFGGNPGELPLAKREKEFVNHESLSRWGNAPDEVVLYPFGLGHFTIADDRIILHPHVLGIHEGTGLHFPRIESSRSPQDVIREALAQAWGCSPDDVWVDSSSGRYEVGLREGVPEETSYVTVIRKPALQDEAE